MDEKILSLIKLARSGDGDAFADLTVAYKPLIESMGKSYAKKCENLLFTEDDFLQEATLGFYSAVRTYEPSDKVTFGLYAKICVRNRLVSLLRASAKKVKKPRKATAKRQDDADPMHFFLEKENFEGLEKKVKDALSGLEWSVFSLYVENKSYKEISETIGRPVKTVDNAICRIRAKLKNIREE